MVTFSSELVGSVPDPWLTDLLGPTYYETNTLGRGIVSSLLLTRESFSLSLSPFHSKFTSFCVEI